MLLELHQRGGISAARARSVARTIQHANPRHIHDGVASEFEKELESRF